MIASALHLRRVPLAAQLVVALGLAAGTQAVLADTPVTDCTDGADAGTLRHVIASAPDAEVINASACANSTITLANGEIPVAQDSLTVYGPADGSLTISGNQAGRVFRHAGSGTFKLQQLSVADGKVSGTDVNQELYGGCIQSNGTVQLDHATIRGCSVIGSYDGDNAQGGGIFAQGAVVIDYSTISGNSAVATSSLRGYAYGGGVDALAGFYSHRSVISGNAVSIAAPAPEYGAGGGISTRQALVLLATTVSANTAGHGGGVYFGGGSTLNVDQSTISGNSAAQHGGGMLVHATLSATNSTFTGNSAGGHGGAIYTSAGLNLTNDTISGNGAGSAGGGTWSHDANLYFCSVYANRYASTGGKGAGVYFTSSATLNATIATSNGSDDIDAPSNIPLSGAYNIIAASGVGVPPDTQNCDVKFGVLANFGGSTKTLPLLSGSCAIDQGPFSPTPALDQRGQLRPVQLVWPAPRADVGAFEKQGADDPEYIFIDGFGAAGSD